MKEIKLSELHKIVVSYLENKNGYPLLGYTLKFFKTKKNPRLFVEKYYNYNDPRSTCKRCGLPIASEDDEPTCECDYDYVAFKEDYQIIEFINYLITSEYNICIRVDDLLVYYHFQQTDDPDIVSF